MRNLFDFSFLLLLRLRLLQREAYYLCVEGFPLFLLYSLNFSYFSYFLNETQALWPPNPSDVDIEKSTSALRATSGV